MVGGEVGIRQPRFFIAMPCVSPTTPFSPKLLHGAPVSAFRGIRVASMVGAKIGRGHSGEAAPATGGASDEAAADISYTTFTSQYETSRQIMCWYVAASRLIARGNPLLM
jgi:hypothetical protein